MADIIQIRRDTAANWTAANPILAQGEFGVETDTLKLKIGDGASPWTGLRYYHSGSPYEAGEGISINDFTINNTGIITIGTGGANGTIKANGEDISVKGLGSAAYVDTTTLPNKDLSNLTSIGQNIANWSSNITNCITEIPQDIKLELNNGVLRLKAGSKVYIPDGPGVFTPFTTTADCTVSQTVNDKHCVYINTSQQLWVKRLSVFVSGTTTPQAISDGIWYNTTENRIEWYNGSAWSGNGGRSFPIAIVTVSNGAISSIDQVFNGFGYIGSTAFALPGVKVLLPQGRNADSTLKNALITKTNVSIGTYNGTSPLYFGISNSTSPIYFQSDTNYSYDPETNTTNWAVGILGHINVVSGVFYDWKTNNVFRATNYEDYKNLSELSSAGANISNWSGNTTNCITEIPQDIQLELNDGVLTLKAGSKYYKPNGSYVIRNTDYDIPIAWNSAASGIIVIGNGSYACYAENRQLSGTTLPTGLSGNSFLFWHTTENKMYWTINGGADWTAAPDCSVPIARVTWGADNKVTSIDQIYNGFGYMGSTIFCLPGVRGLVPNGRKEDGTLKNRKAINNVFRTKTFTGSASLIMVMYTGGAIDGWSTLNYNSDRNINYNSNGIQYLLKVGRVVCGSGGQITLFSANQVFQSANFEDIANLAMPSLRYINLTLPSTGGNVTAPSDGYLVVVKSATASGQYFYFINNTSGYSTGVQSGGALNCRLAIPVSKGNTITVNYDTSGNTVFFRFIYANGSK